MPSTYSTNLRVELQADGENSTTWGAKANVVFQMLEQAISGVVSVTHDDTASYTLTSNNGASDEARNMVILVTGALTAARNLVVPTSDKLYVVKNATTGGYAVTVKTSGGSGISVANGETEILYCDATDVIRAQTTPTGTGAPVRATSPTLVTPALGTPSALVGTNITGTAAGLTAGNVTTNANLTGHVISTGNAAVLGSFTLAQLNTAVSDANVAAAGANGDITSLTALTSASGHNLTGGINSKLSTVASAATPDIFAITVGNLIDYTGTTTCTGFVAAPQAGAERTLVCAGAAVFTAGANMLIDGVASASNFTAAAGDKIIVRAVSTTQFRLTPQKYNGLVTALGAANLHLLMNAAGTNAEWAVSSGGGTITRSMVGATGAVAETGLGFKPRSILFFASWENQLTFSVGMYAGGGNKVIYLKLPSTQAALSSTCIQLTDGSTTQFAVVNSLDADGFTLGWTLAGPGVGQSATIHYLAFR